MNCSITSCWHCCESVWTGKYNSIDSVHFLFQQAFLSLSHSVGPVVPVFPQPYFLSPGWCFHYTNKSMTANPVTCSLDDAHMHKAAQTWESNTHTRYKWTKTKSCIRHTAVPNYTQTHTLLGEWEKANISPTPLFLFLFFLFRISWRMIYINVQ